ncbi:organic solute transporter alpha-like protein [Homalodisca vitripennis]|uniref:organic solute transporter alpha-like protein n=1 Tax=Homalodisca vitripennis TaxID=197043 RepID=UPI001EEB9D4A|nr:organic solute transporter alpha-like protein [Homalodisca vitripennis]
MEYNVSDAEVLEVIDPLDQNIIEAARPYNSSLIRPDCTADLIPSLDQYFTAFNIWGVLLFSLGGLAVCIVLVATYDVLKHVLSFSPPLSKTHSAVILSVYPVVALATYCATVVPRAQLLAEAITQGMFMVAMYQLFCLMVAYCGGEAELIRKVKPMSLSPRVGPCCCWPCCCCLPLLHIDKDRVRWLRVLVLQLPVVQGLVYMVLLVMWAEEQSLYQVNYMYLQPLVIISILCGVWGIIMTMKMLTEVLQGYHVQGKFIVLQLVLILAKLQGVWARLFVWFGWLPCRPPITPTVYANLAYNSLMLWEMVLLCLCARHLYKRSLPEQQPPTQHSSLPQQIHTINQKILPTLNNNSSIKY